MITNCSIDDLKSIISEVIKSEIKLPPPVQPNEYKTRKETAAILGISLPTLNEYTKKGILVGYRIGSRVRYKTAQIDEALKQIQSLKYRRR